VYLNLQQNGSLHQVHNVGGWGYDASSENPDLGRGEYYDESLVSLQPNGILRLSATKLSSTYSCYDGNTLRTFTWKSGMIQTKNRLG
jgi:hypothetical protein